MVPDRDQYASRVPSGRWNTVSGFLGPSFSPPPLSNNPAMVVAWTTPVQTDLPGCTCQGIDQWICTGILLRISLNRVNAKPSIAQYSSTLVMPALKQLDCRQRREMEKWDIMPARLVSSPRTAAEQWSRCMGRREEHTTTDNDLHRGCGYGGAR